MSSYNTLTMNSNQSSNKFTLHMDLNQSSSLTLSQRQRENKYTLSLSTPVAMSMNYENLKNKPRINGVELVGNLTFEDLGLYGTMDNPILALSAEEIDDILEIHQ